MLWRHGRSAISAVSALTLVFELALGVGVTRAAESEDDGIGATPPRLSYADGEVSFFRPGAQDWAPAQVNTPLAPGDELYTGHRGNLELQIGARAFVRAWGDSQIGLVNHDPDFLQIKVTGGHVSLDLRNIDSGSTVEIDTPHAAFTIERAGYYRVDVTETRSSFVTRRAGQATMTPAGGQAVAIAASEEVVLEGTSAPAVRSYVAPEPDVWDRWNYARTDELIDAISSRYVSAGVYGVDDLDQLRRLARRPDVRLRVGSAVGSLGLGALQQRSVGSRSLLRLDLGRHRAVGLGPLSLRPMGARERLLGLGSGTRGRQTSLRPGARRVLRRTERACGDRRSRHQLGRAGVGRAPGPMVGKTAVHRPTDVGRLGRTALRQ